MVDKYKKVCLVILDGWGYSMNFAGNAIRLGNPKQFDLLLQNYGHKFLNTFDKSMEFAPTLISSEICHTQISAGCFVKSESDQVFEDIKCNLHLSNKPLQESFKYALQNDSRVHIVCPIDEDSHSIDYLSAVLAVAENYKSIPLFLHLVVTKNCSESKLRNTLDLIDEIIAKSSNCRIATIFGSKYSSGDQNELKDGILAYDSMARGNGSKFFGISQAVDESFKNNLKPREIAPSVIIDNGKAIGLIHDFDSIVFTAISVDSVKLLFSIFANKLKVPGSVQKYNLKLLALTDYLHIENKLYQIAFESGMIEPNLTKVISDHGILQVHISGSLKSDNVGYFFDGRNSNKYPGEKLITISESEYGNISDDKSIQNYITKVGLDQLMTKENKFVLMNFASVDNYAHTKDIKKTSLAVKYIDECLTILYEASKQYGFVLVITGDHGNAESMASVTDIIQIDEHSNSPVPFIIVSSETKKHTERASGNKDFNNLLSLKSTVCDIAPTILDIFGIESPKEFTGSSLLNNLD